MASRRDVPTLLFSSPDVVALSSTGPSNAMKERGDTPLSCVTSTPTKQSKNPYPQHTRHRQPKGLPIPPRNILGVTRARKSPR